MIKSTASLVGSTAEDRRREALEKVLVVEALLLAVDPAPAERDLHRLGCRPSRSTSGKLVYSDWPIVSKGRGMADPIAPALNAANAPTEAED